LVVAVDIAGLVRQQRRRRRCVDCEHALLLFVFEVGLKLGPDRFCALGWTDQEFFVPRIGRHVMMNEVAHIDRVAPGPWLEVPPATLIFCALRKSRRSPHGISPLNLSTPTLLASQ